MRPPAGLLPPNRRHAKPGSQQERPARRALLIMTGTALVAFAVVGPVTVTIAHGIARHNALDEAERSARSIAETVFLPALPGALAGDSADVAQLQRVVSARHRDGSIVHVKVWTLDGTVVYSDESSIIGHRFPV